MEERRYARIFLLIPALIVLYFVFRIFQPFLQPIALAIIFSTLCHPVYRWLLRLLKDRANLASLIMCLLVMAVIIIPLATLISALVSEVAQVYQLLQSNLDKGTFDSVFAGHNSHYLTELENWLSAYMPFSKEDVVKAVTTGLQQLGGFLVRQSTVVLGGFAGLVSQFILMVLTMFFLFRDGSRLFRQLETLTPISKRYEQLLATKFREVTQATVLGTLVTAVAQGLAGGVIFWILGISNSLFWGTLMGFCSMVPVVGTSVVWVPWVLYFVFSGAYWHAAILAGLAAFLVGMIDNVVRPLFIEGRSGMHTLVVFFSLMGGAAYFGVVGLIFGPILVSLFLTFLELYRIEFQSELSKPQA
ncbi:MAG: AI-2E family transporter [Acidobacteriota bacterium]